MITSGVFCGKPESRRTPTDLVSVPHEICVAIYLPLGLLCDSEQKQRKPVWDSKDKDFEKKWSNKRNKIDEHEVQVMTSQLSENEQSAKFG